MTKQNHHHHGSHAKPETPTAEDAPQPAAPEPQAVSAETATVQSAAAPTLDQQLADALKMALEWRDKCLRSAADFDNYRKRVQRDLQETRIREKSASVQAFLTVLDHFQMAHDHFETNPDLNTMKQGLDMIHAEFRNAITVLGVEPVNAAGAEFNPKIHEAISYEPSDTVPAGTVTRQWKAGYKIGEILLRPASVIVSSGPVADAVEEDK